MEITYHGANCFKVTSKNSTIIVDDNLKAVGLKGLALAGVSAELYTQRLLKPDEQLSEAIIIDGPGEYELNDLTVLGVQTRAYMDKDDEKTATIYKVINGDHKLLFLGHVQPKLDAKVLDKIGVVDVLFVPVGGNGYTLDAVDATEVVKLLSPKIIVPCHYKDSAIKYDVQMNDPEEFYTKLGATDTNHMNSLKLKGEIVESIITLERQS